MKVKFLNNDGGGFAQEVCVSGEVTLTSFLGDYLQGDPSNYTLRVNGQPQTGTYMLQDGDFVSALPAKIAGA